MNVRQRRKLFAGAGMITMLLGALLVLAPSGANAETTGGGGGSGNDDCASLLSGAEVSKYNGNVAGGGEYTASGAFGVDFTVTKLEGTGFRFDFTAEKEVSFVFIKQAAAKQGLSQGFVIDPADEEGFVVYEKANAISHITFCHGELVCEPDSDPFKCQPPCEYNSELPADSDDCAPEECPYNPELTVEDDGCDPAECPEGEFPTSTNNDDGIIEDGECEPACPHDAEIPTSSDDCQPPATCPTGSVHVDGNGNELVDEGECDYCPNLGGIQGAGTNCNPIVGCVGDCGFTPPPTDACPDLDGFQEAGTDCDPVVVTDACPAIPGIQRLPQSCIEVLDEVEEPEPPVEEPVEEPVVGGDESPPAPEDDKPAVMGDVVNRTLPRTGSESQNLAAFGAGLLLLGAGLVLTSRSRFARVD